MATNIPSLLNCTLSEITEGLDSGIFLSVQLVKAYLARIEEVDDEFHSVIEVNPDALQIAELLDAERKVSGSRGCLHGIPLLLKDNIVTLDSMEATCGSHALIGAKPENESTVVTALRRAGAIILGKTNLAEWVGFRSTSGCSGWSPRGGQSRGIFYPGMKASGSSSGSAIATALGLAFASFGTETVFSIVSPAHRSGVIGFKPTRGLIPSEGIIYASQRQDTVGLHTRTVIDAAKIHNELGWWTDSSPTRPNKSTDDYMFNLDLRGTRVGIPRIKELRNAKIEAFCKALIVLGCAGAEIVWDIDIPGVDKYDTLSPASKDIIPMTELKTATNSYLSSLKTNPQSINNLEDLIDFTKNCDAEEYPKRNVAVLEKAQATNPSDDFYRTMLAKEEYFVGEGGISAALDRHNLHVLLVPSLSVTMQVLAGKAGSPVVSVPMGIYPDCTKIECDPKNGFVTVAPNIPFSVFIYGRPHMDHDVLRVAYAVEQLTEMRKHLKPYKTPSKDLVDFTSL